MQDQRHARCLGSSPPVALMVDARTLEEAIVRKRGELEESLIRIDELQAAIHQREAVLANPRPPALQMAQREAAHALYDSLAAGSGADDFGLEVTPAADPAGLRLIEWADSQSLDYSDDEDPLSRFKMVPSIRSSSQPGVSTRPSEAGKALDFLRSLLPVAPPGRGAADTRSRGMRAGTPPPADSRQPSAVLFEQPAASEQANEHAKSPRASRAWRPPPRCWSPPLVQAGKSCWESHDEHAAAARGARIAPRRSGPAGLSEGALGGSLLAGPAPAKPPDRYSLAKRGDTPAASRSLSSTAPPPLPQDQRSMSAVVELPGAAQPVRDRSESPTRRSRTATQETEVEALTEAFRQQHKQQQQQQQHPASRPQQGRRATGSFDEFGGATMSACAAHEWPRALGREASPRVRSRPGALPQVATLDAACLNPLIRSRYGRRRTRPTAASARANAPGGPPREPLSRPCPRRCVRWEASRTATAGSYYSDDYSQERRLAGAECAATHSPEGRQAGLLQAEFLRRARRDARALDERVLLGRGARHVRAPRALSAANSPPPRPQPPRQQLEQQPAAANWPQEA